MFTDIRAAFAAVRKALTERGGDSPLSRYTICHGSVFAQSASMTAVAPCDFLDGLAFSVGAKNMDDALAKLKGDISAAFADGMLELKAGRSRVCILTTVPDHDGIRADDIKLGRAPKDLVEVLKRLSVFGDKTAQPPWMASVIMSPKYTCVASTGGRVLAVSAVALGNGMLPLSAAEFLVSRGQPKGWKAMDDVTYVSWEDGSWARLSMVTGAFPSALESLVAKSDTKPKWKVTEEWRAALKNVAALSDSFIRISAKEISGTRGPLSVEEGIKTSIKGPARFDADLLQAVAAEASTIDFDAELVTWRGEHLRGLMVRMLG